MATVSGNLCPGQTVVEIISCLKLQDQDDNHAKCTYWTKSGSTNRKKYIENTSRSDMKLLRVTRKGSEVYM